jgi:hypothetical protein
MLESLRQNWKLALSLFSSVVAAAVIVCLLIDWRNSTATLSALFGALVGWALGILLAPYEDEEKRGERIRNILELADRVQSLARGDRMYLTLARRGRRVQICVTASP